MLTKRKLFLLFISVLALSLVLVFTFRESLRPTLIVPVLYMSWLSKLVYGSIDQAILWIFTLLIILLILGLSLRRPPKPLQQEVASEGNRSTQSRLRYWMVLTRYAFGDKFFRDRFSIELKKIILGVLAEREYLTPEQVDTRLELGEIQIPQDIKRYLIINSLPTIYEKPPFSVRVRNFIKSIFDIPRLKSQSSTQQMDNEKQMDMLLNFIEKQLEITHDNQHT